ncbi:MULTISPECIES: transglycosylase SLT domain-containing protein [Rhizobium]|uniref:Transglycosylase SLT domain-containing protein n=1 Tax=Rhizobium rhododendri TaxID=2506430 RepID=A0ABY8IS20_9HYPH|nr:MULTISPECIES: transglycosylase SLT domain-containing protein [Rhizobium]MBO9100755.1 transglycosylase SLT domain-containing protein [Rhizobium sp. L58/93]MBO9135881.1 transglycosylase SLT domain-containing protein [Rhizobium sp. B209b/85]MBO9171193.1 transglycosylase SLT domain-containing protein [Rhizobium sp. L245/93]MBO9187062.1 transglycosylase SLT domain-containing protein [Rhizobium sp. E27B/91]MBZ5759509.1 transglycosylase SLT domain-containing protein [Rhizobium sp. VS19-DR96]
MRKLFIAALVVLSSCATAPHQIRNSCAIFEQRDGLFNNWRRAADKASREYGVPVPVLMATIYVESGFQPYARPPRTLLLGFIPWTRPSSAYGYAQALDGTWSRYQRATGHWSARRTNFADAINFIGWYHAQSHLQNGIALNDTYNLYMAYYVGHDGYSRGSFRSNGELQRTARRAAGIASTYNSQLRTCGG